MNLLLVVSLLTLIAFSNADDDFPSCVRCTPCGEQISKARLEMVADPSMGHMYWKYPSTEPFWTAVKFSDNSKENFIITGDNVEKHIYIIEMKSSDIGAQPEYFWIDSDKTETCVIDSLEHPRISYHSFNTIVYQ